MLEKLSNIFDQINTILLIFSSSCFLASSIVLIIGIRNILIINATIIIFIGIIVFNFISMIVYRVFFKKPLYTNKIIYIYIISMLFAINYYLTELSTTNNQLLSANSLFLMLLHILILRFIYISRR